MDLCVFTPALKCLPFDEVLSFLNRIGIGQIELACGGFSGKEHCDPSLLLDNPDLLSRFRDLLRAHQIEIAALSCHGNPVHPNQDIAKRGQEDFENAVLLAEKLGVQRIVTFSGCPGDHPGAEHPNWVVCAWPPEYSSILQFQWQERLVPYWKKAAAFAQDHGISQIALELHPGFSVYNPETCLRLRAEAGTIIGANVDPSHLFWQGIDPSYAIRALGTAVHFFHAKDTYLDQSNIRINGVLDAKPYTEIPNRAWTFRTAGLAHGSTTWNQIFYALRLAGYNGPVSIEQEDPLLNAQEGIKKSVSFLSSILLENPPGQIWWA